MIRQSVSGLAADPALNLSITAIADTTNPFSRRNRLHFSDRALTALLD
jgi:hypothetical protein